MCTSILTNRNKTIAGFNLDILDMEYRVTTNPKGVYIEINDAIEGWMPLFGANSRGDFVTMPTCWPYDDKSDPKSNETNIIMLDIDLLLEKKTFIETKDIVTSSNISSFNGITYQSQLSDRDGNVLQVIPGQGYKYYEKPKQMVMTNFSPFKMDKEKHPWMGLDRYELANRMLSEKDDDFNENDCFEILKAVSQQICPTVISMVYDVNNRIVYWCTNQNWANTNKYQLNLD